MAKKQYVKPQTPQGYTAAAKEVKIILEKGFMPFPENSRFNGSGAPGLYLEHLLGVDGNNRDQPDLNGWEVKYHGGGTLLTLFHKTPEPKNIMEYMVNAHGWRNDKQQMCFRHTISRESDRGFYVVSDGNRIIVRHREIDGPVPTWTHDTLVNALVSKLRRLILVEGGVSKHPINGVTYKSARAFWEINPSGFIRAIESGMVKIDFDARTQGGARTTLRDHGTKFRIQVADLQHLYLNNTKIT